MASVGRSGLLTKVVFRLEVQYLQHDQTVFLVGDSSQLGLWSPSSAIKFSRKAIPSQGGISAIWEGIVDLPTGIPVIYKYLIIGRDRRIKWESSKSEFRTVTPHGYEMIVQDGQFGRETDQVWVDEGWLNSEIEVRVELGFFNALDGSYTPPVTGPIMSNFFNSVNSDGDDSFRSNFGDDWLSSSTASSSFPPNPELHDPNFASNKPLTLHFFDVNSRLSHEVVPLPLQDAWTEVVFHMSDLHKLKITVEAYDSQIIDPNTRYVGESQASNDWKRLGRTSITYNLLKEMRGVCSLPLFNHSLDHVGTFNFKYLIVTPFKHPLNNLASIWKSYTRASKPIGKSVGHRGCGSTRTSVISENTLLSFLTAADYGADYVEFDVQMTKDGVPVINHDFHIPVTNNEGATHHVPVSSLTKRQFKTLRPSSSCSTHNGSQQSNPIKSSNNLMLSSVIQKIPGLMRSKSLNNLPYYLSKHHKRKHSTTSAEQEGSTNTKADLTPSSSSSATITNLTPPKNKVIHLDETNSINPKLILSNTEANSSSEDLLDSESSDSSFTIAYPRFAHRISSSNSLSSDSETTPIHSRHNSISTHPILVKNDHGLATLEESEESENRSARSSTSTGTDESSVSSYLATTSSVASNGVSKISPRLPTPSPSPSILSHDVPKSIINPHDSFATLEETLRLVPAGVGFVIEIKYPAERFQLETKLRCHERNQYVDAVLECVFASLNNPETASRNMMFISFDPDVCVLLSQKQPRFPVLFLVTLSDTIPVGPEDTEVEGYDPRTQTIEMAIKFAKSVRLQGIVSNAAAVLKDPTIVTKVHDVGLILMTYGPQNMNADYRAVQKASGVDSLIVDNVVHINRFARKRNQVSPMFVADYGRQNFKVAQGSQTGVTH